MGKGIVRIYNTDNATGPTPPPILFFVPPCYVSSPKNVSTSDCGASTIYINWTSPVSNLTTTNKVDTNINNDNNPQSFATPRKHNHIAT